MRTNWHDFNPHADVAVYVPLEELARCCAGGTLRFADGTEVSNDVRFVLGTWRTLGDKVDGYIVTGDDGNHLVCIRFGGEEYEYIEEDVRNPEVVAYLLARYPVAMNCGTIRFLGNPWPGGHRITDFAWGGHISEHALFFDFHLVSEDYDAHDDPDEIEEEGLGDWESKGCWGNYHRCTLSSTDWEEEVTGGFVVGSREFPFDAGKLSSETFRVDIEPDKIHYRWGDLAFHIYLLGHDSVADHTIRFGPSDTDGKRAISWSGRIALTYAGQESYDYEFMAEILPTAFQGFAIPKDMDDTRAWQLLREFVTDTGCYRLVHREGGRFFVWR